MYLFGFAVTIELFQIWPKFRESQVSWDFLLSVPTSSLCRNNFPSGSTPPNSTNRERLPSIPKTTGFRNIQKKNVRDEDELLFFRELFFNVVFGRLRTNCEVVLFDFSFPMWERRFGFSSEPALVQITRSPTYIQTPTKASIKGLTDDG